MFGLFGCHLGLSLCCIVLEVPYNTDTPRLLATYNEDKTKLHSLSYELVVLGRLPFNVSTL